MTHTQYGLVAILLATAAIPQARSAAEVDLFSMTPVYPGARAAGMGGAYEAVSEDWTASFWNPAGLARLRRVEFSGSFSMANRENSVAISSDGRPSDRRNSYAALDHIGYAMPVPTYRGSLVWGAGYARLQDFRLPWSLREGDTRIDVEEKGHAGALSFSVASQLGQKLLGGASLMLVSGHDEYLFRATTGGSEERDYSETDLSGWAIKFGGLYHPLRQLWLGASLRTPMLLAVDNQGYDYRFTLPAEMSLSAAWQEYGWLVNGSLHLSDWSQASYDDIANGGDLELNREVSQGYQQTMRLALGGEYTVPGTDLRLRAGAWTRGLAQNDQRLTERLESGDVHYWNYRDETRLTGMSLGLGILFDELISADLAWQQERGKLSWLDQAAPDAPELRISEEQRSNRLTLSLTIRM
ncbi:MAG: hypothetical protein KDC10_03470 [Calditrichaeota bacterium]|nr:hypothetical protein [Candidatus Cloacimonadota bacterium]MCB1046238.1 hypothetical protein [Calditrichota bacterium]MCB9474215.1 hypothetical protein [Candidatus Delongbacteria bacterium]